MFGRRPDGSRLDKIDPIVMFTPYIMKTRNDATNLVTEYVDYEPMAEYVRKRSKEGVKISFMALVMAAYVRACAEYPAMNRFIMNKQIFARNKIIISLTVVKESKDNILGEEALIKMEFAPDATIDEVAAQVDAKIAEAQAEDSDNGTVNFARKMMHFRILVQGVVWAARFLDRYGLLPGALYDISPFHCSMYLTNMASINMPPIFHHLYNFGNTSMFVAMGKYEKQLVKTKNGLESKLVLPLNITTDERICGGAEYALAFGVLKKMLAHPELLEQRPERIVHEKF